jgi:hypothetical protein
LDRSGVDDVAVVDRAPTVVDVITGGYRVVGADGAGEFESSGHVVVVQVGFQHVSDADLVLVGEGEHAVDVALRIDDHGDAVVGDQIAAVTESGGFDDRDVHVLLLCMFGHLRMRVSTST